MSLEHVSHREIVRFAEDRVNLPRDKANEYRAQARGLRERLESYLSEHPDFSLRKMLLSGSLAKGTALRSLNDIDVACYISGVHAPADVPALLQYLAERLRKAYPNFTPDQVKPQTYSVTVSFKGSGLDVDVVPILYSGSAEWDGNLVSQDDGSLLMTNIPKHLAFAKRRRENNDPHYAQVVRLIKFWVKNMKRENADFRCKSFIVELVLAHLADRGAVLKDYPNAMLQFFNYVASSDLRKQIVFADYYQPSKVGSFSDRVQIIDPVNPANNVGSRYTVQQADTLTSAALDAGDAIEAALRAPTKQDTVRYWQKVFGPSFQV